MYSRLDVVRRLAATAHSTMVTLGELNARDVNLGGGLTDTEELALNLARHTFDALSSCIGLANAVNQWRLDEIRPRAYRPTPIQRRILAQHGVLSRRNIRAEVT